VVISIVIAHVGDKVNLALNFGSVRSEDFPVIASIFKLNLSVEFLNQMFADFGGSCELSQTDLSLLKDLFHDGTFTVNHIQIFLGESTVVHHANPLLKYITAAHVRLDEGFVSHVEGAHILQDRDLNWEVEGADNADGSKRPSETLRELTVVIAGVGETTSKESNLISTKVLIEISSNSDFSFSLRPTLRHCALGAFDHEVENFGIMEDFSSLSCDFS